MTRDEARTFIQSNAAQILQRDKSGKGYLCPICGSGKGKNGTGITSRDGIHFTCWAGCFSNSDIIDIIGLQHGLGDYTEKLEKACDIFRVSLDPRAPLPQRQEPSAQYTHNSIHTSADTQPQRPEADYTAYYRECAARIDQTDYWKRRGLSREVVGRFMVGYDPDYKKNTGPEGWQALIIPTSRGTYIARNTAENAEKNHRYRKSEKTCIFNSKALQTAQQPIFIVEGEIDALAVMSVGGEAVGLGSTSKTAELLRITEKNKPVQPLIIALDNDEAGQKAADELGAGLQRQGITSYRVNPYGDCKDAGEAILKDPEGFRAAVAQAANIEEAALEAEREAYQSNTAAYYLQSFIDGIADSVATPCVQTGFITFDRALDGGLYEGLYIVGAISSLGKTTLITQIGDQIAQAGNDVLIFSLEMARSELMAKSISRHSFIRSMAANRPGEAKTARGITDGRRYINYSNAEQQLIQESIKDYAAYAQHIFIHEGIGNIGIEQIRETVEKHIRLTGKRPVCIVDYLQILAPYSDRVTEKQATDHNVMELKRISRDNKVPVIAISSFNRANYAAAASMEAFKESGGVEYSSDVLIGLQLKGAGEKDFNATEAKSKNPREVEAVILKNRNGRVGEKVAFRYSAMFNYFAEVE